MHLIDAIVIFFKSFTLLLRYGIVEPIPVTTHKFQQVFDRLAFFGTLFLRIDISVVAFVSWNEEEICCAMFLFVFRCMVYIPF